MDDYQDLVEMVKGMISAETAKDLADAGSPASTRRAHGGTAAPDKPAAQRSKRGAGGTPA